MYFCDADNRETKEAAPGVRIKTFWHEKMLMSLVELDPHAVVPTHSHENEQCGTIMSGEMTLTIADETRVLQPGDSYIIPGNVEHSAVAGGELTKVVDVFAPVREDYMY